MNSPFLKFERRIMVPGEIITVIKSGEDNQVWNKGIINIPIVHYQDLSCCGLLRYCKGVARTQTPTVRNCDGHSSYLPKRHRSAWPKVQWTCLAMKEPPTWSRLPPAQVSMSCTSTELILILNFVVIIMVPGELKRREPHRVPRGPRPMERGGPRSSFEIIWLWI